MKRYLVVHHTVTKQFTTNPRHPSLEFYNYVITPTEVVGYKGEGHQRGNGIKSFDVALTGDFRKDEPTEFQIEALKEVIKHHGYEVIGHKELKKRGATLGKLETECPGNLMSYLKEKKRYQTKNKNAFVCLAITDNEIPKNYIIKYIQEFQKKIYQLSKERLVLDIQVFHYHLPFWSNNKIKKIVSQDFEENDYQAVIAIYKIGKFRKAMAETSKLAFDKLILINQSFEDTSSIKKDTILIHEMMHAFMAYLDLPDRVHDSPNEFEDDFKFIEPYIEKLYYHSPEAPKPEKEEKPKEADSNVPTLTPSFNPHADVKESQLRKRFKSFLWRAGMMFVALFIDWLLENIGLFGLSPQVTVFLGLVLGEISKYLNKKK